MAANRKYNDIGSAWLGALNWQEAGEALRKRPVVIPLGGSAVEHGPHLPYDTDRTIAEALVEAVAERTPVLITPTIDYVYAPEVAGRGGTVSLRPESFIALVSDIIRSLARHGARRFFIINCGTGTLAPLNVVAREMHRELGVTVAVTNPDGLAWDARREICIQSGDGHAGTRETAQMLALDGERVKMDQAAAGESQILRDEVIVPLRVESESGVIGDPTAASAEEGQHLFTAAVNEIVAYIEGPGGKS